MKDESNLSKIFTFKVMITVGANRGLSTYTQVFSPKKTGFPPVKNTSQSHLPLFYAIFSVRTLQYFQKKFKLFFSHQKCCLIFLFYIYAMQLFSADPTIFSKKC